MRKQIMATGLCMTALTMLVFLSYQVAAEPDAQGNATTGESPPIAEPRAKIAAQPSGKSHAESMPTLFLDRWMDNENHSHQLVAHPEYAKFVWYNLDSNVFIRQYSGFGDAASNFELWIDEQGLKALPDTFEMRMTLPQGEKLEALYHSDRDEDEFISGNSHWKQDATRFGWELSADSLSATRVIGYIGDRRANVWTTRPLLLFTLSSYHRDIPNDFEMRVGLYYPNTETPFLESTEVILKRLDLPSFHWENGDSVFYVGGKSSIDIKLYGKNLQSPGHYYGEGVSPREVNILKLGIGYLIGFHDSFSLSWIVDGGMFQGGITAGPYRDYECRIWRFGNLSALPDSGLVATLRVSIRRGSGRYPTDFKNAGRGELSWCRGEAQSSSTMNLVENPYQSWPVRSPSSMIAFIDKYAPDTISLRADLNKDGQVDFSDWLLWAGYFERDDLAGDLNGDGFVNFSDWIVLVTEYGKTKHVDG